ncbi:SURF1 family protein [Nocardiopsis ansamitocini]|uniref:SURF1-like protein n=1 Tax=Nocardiopsis ansamitocini TaxID=1670832 RepID=A0A9W6P4M4_9ACTN|nr:SURF1 family protein [Nocardiopsis ansamitocini]GLU47264.1 SURF1-like protein [Nocardiopsis ansamitocini]
MRFPLLRPNWLGIHLTALLAVLCCISFGYWQYQSAQQPDRATITNPVEDLNQADAIEDLLAPGDYMPQSLANEAVRATGAFDTNAQLLAPALSPEGQEGYYVITPLVTSGDTAVIVNRGWLPAEAADAPPPAAEGEVTVEGWLLPPQNEVEKGYTAMSVPDGQVARIAPALLVNEWPYRLYEGYVTLAGQTPAPTAGAAEGLREIPPPQPPEEISWNFRNLSYAAQWWVFAVAALAFWASLVRRELADRRAADGSEDGHGSAGPQPSAAGAVTD